METTLITTPSGHKVTIKNGLTYGENRQIQRVIAGGMKVDPKTQETSIDGSAIYDSQDLAVKMTVQSIQLANGTVVQGGEQCLALILSWEGAEEEDGKAIYDKINDLTKSSTTPEKRGASNGTSTPSTGTARAESPPASKTPTSATS